MVERDLISGPHSRDEDCGRAHGDQRSLKSFPSAGNLGTKAALGVVLGATRDTGVSVLLTVSICLIFFM